uniref:Uncharacterized protein n=1 Tax=Aegilops tauschii subsp. strangulata TaxID=200361 RepID=A0A453QBI9_AEGTS
CRVIPVSHSISSYYLPLLQPCCIAAWAPTMLLLTSSSVRPKMCALLQEPVMGWSSLCWLILQLNYVSYFIGWC